MSHVRRRPNRQYERTIRRKKKRQYLGLIICLLLLISVIAGISAVILLSP
ncbi:MAG: hypothetical protein ACFFAO_08710 [Candidatus Hermodarchaeota archaeon]